MTQQQKLADLQQTWTREQISKATRIRHCDLQLLHYQDVQLSEKDARRLDRLHELEFGGEE